jgi:hypothetical protein
VLLGETIIAPARSGFEREQVTVLFDRCQVLAGRFGELSAAVLLSKMDELVVELPASLNRPEQIMIGGVLGHLLARLVRRAGIDGRPDVARAFFDLTDAGPTMKNWCLKWFRATACCVAALPSDVEKDEAPILDLRVETEIPERPLNHGDSGQPAQNGR